MKFGSLFSGIGGFDLAFERAGMTCAWQCEIDPKASAVLARHWPDVINHKDVKNVGRNAESVDLICGGFPCQDLSVAGKRKGLAGERSGLWFEFHRILSELKPQWVVIENVPGLLSSNRGRDFAVLLSGLADIGYLSAWRVLDAQYFGVAQRRRRVFIVASLGDGRAAEVLFEREGVRWDTPPRRKAGEEVAYTVRSSPSHSGDKGDGGINTTLITGTLDGKCTAANRGSQANEAEFVVPISAHETGKGKSHTVVANTFRMAAFGDYSDDGSGSALKARDYKDATDLVCWEMKHAGEAYRESGEVAPVLQARMGTGGNNIPLVGVRRLTPTECERLQGFPDGWTDGQADSSRYRQLGNAVAVPVVEWIGKRIVDCEVTK